jgi:hypothetical protein
VLLRLPLLAALAGLLLCGAASADDQPFLTLDTTDIEPQFAHELEQDFSWAIDGSSSPLQMRSELEYGLEDYVQIAGAIDYGWERSGTTADAFQILDAGGEALVQLWNVDFDPLGVGVLVSADAGSDLMDVDATLLLQKNFLNDRLRFVINTGWTGQWERASDAAGNQWEQDSTVEFAAGLAYSITWTWSAGLEFDNERAFQGLLIDGRDVPDTSVYFAGPTLQYVAHPLTASLGFQAQLPWASGRGEGANNGFAPDTERYRVGIRLTRSF